MEFYTLGRGFRLDQFPQCVERFSKYGAKCLANTLEDLPTVIFILYRMLLRRYKPVFRGKYRPFSVYIRMNLLLYIGSHLNKSYTDALAVYEKTEVTMYQIEEIGISESIPGLPTTSCQLGKISSISKRMMSFYFKGTHKRKLLAESGYFLEEKNGRTSKQQTELVQNREEII